MLNSSVESRSRHPARLMTWATVAIHCTLAIGLTADEAERMAEANAHVQSEFQRLDRDTDQNIALAEFLIRDGNEAVLVRDFHLYDFDGNGSLTRSEFASVSGLGPPEFRGRIPDPFEYLVDQAVSALDESYLRWNERPRELVNAHTFVGNFIASISPGGKRYVTGRILREADLDSDGRLSRAEARGFIRHQLGIHWSGREPLREPTGRLVRLDRFLVTDTDKSRGLSHQEFLARDWDRDTAGKDFVRFDRNADGTVHFVEFAHYSHAENYFDPIEYFRAADTNLDGLLNERELLDSTDVTRRHLVSSALSGFDSDNDRRLTLKEFRLSMLAAVNYPWHHRAVDLNRDGQLSYDEFLFHDVDLFQLQRRYFFHRLDLNGDGVLKPSEFSFLSKAPNAIHLRSTSDGEKREVYSDARFPKCGWPSISPARDTLLFQRQMLDSLSGQGAGESRIVSINLQGHNLRVLCEGAKPSWAPDGNRFVCERHADDAGVWIMRPDGRSGRRIADGHSPSWSPDGKKIAWLDDNGIVVYDVDKEAAQTVLARSEHHYRDLGGDVAWSPDSRHLAVLGRDGNLADLVILTLGRQPPEIAASRRVRHTFTTECGENLSWTAQDRIIVAVQNPETDRFQLVSIQPQGVKRPKPSARLLDSSDQKSACVTPDGKWYIVVTGG